MAITNSFFPSEMLFCYNHLLQQQTVKVTSENQVGNKVHSSLDIMPLNNVFTQIFSLFLPSLGGKISFLSKKWF